MPYHQPTPGPDPRLCLAIKPASTLQTCRKSLLPPHTPILDGATELAARLAAAEDAEEYGGGDPLAMDAADLEAALDEALQRQADPLIHDTPGSRRDLGLG